MTTRTEADASPAAAKRRARRWIAVPTFFVLNVGIASGILLLAGLLIVERLDRSVARNAEVLEQSQGMGREIAALSDATDRIVDQDLRALASLLRLVSAASALELAMTEHLYEPDPARNDLLERTRKALQLHGTALVEAWPGGYAETHIEAVQKSLRMIDSIVLELVEITSPVQIAELNDETRGALAALQQSLDAIRDQSLAVGEANGRLLKDTAREAVAESAEVSTSAARIDTLLGTTRTKIVTILIGLPIILGLLQFFMAVKLGKRLRYLSGIVRRLAHGDTQIDLAYTSRDSLGDVLRAVESMIQTQRERARVAEQISERDLSGSFTSSSNTDRLGAALSQMLDKLGEDVHQVSGSSQTLQTQAGQVSSGSAELAQSAAEQAAALSQISSSTSALAERIRAEAQRAEQAGSDVARAQAVAGEGLTEIEALQAAMQETDDVVREIVNVVTFIDEIAFQT
ncbi:MAG: methyl-accepting chemotaxis protein, partial [Gammaproteobacteria bacterium]|nr:methyl-accepting chemotaxis protein [Gammaproteobacteria bacterium]